MAVATWVCWHISSDTTVRYAETCSRHGIGRRCRANQASKALRSAGTAEAEADWAAGMDGAGFGRQLG